MSEILKTPLQQPLCWVNNSAYSTRFADIYFQPHQGLEESRTVFLEGCGLSERLANQQRFCVGELGTGMGLNVLALLDLWRKVKSADARLYITTIEAYPVEAQDVARALTPYKEIADLTEHWIDQWPKMKSGIHHIAFPELGAEIQIILAEAKTALSRLEAKMNAWFLDGFAPSRNPEMWDAEVLSAVAERSASGCYLASFTVAGFVRRGLTNLGFKVEKQKGFGRKRERLVAILPEISEVITPIQIPMSEQTSAKTMRFLKRQKPKTVAIIGAGIAGASLVKAFRDQGLAVDLFDAPLSESTRASSNPAALVLPRLDAGLGAGARLHAEAFSYGCQLYRQYAKTAMITQGALQLGIQKKDAHRFAKVLTWNGFAEKSLELWTSQEIARVLGDDGRQGGEDGSQEAIFWKQALVLDPSSLIHTFLETTIIQQIAIHHIRKHNGLWGLYDEANKAINGYDHLCLAGGFAMHPLLQSLFEDGFLDHDLPLVPVRGQVSFCENIPSPSLAISYGHYAIPSHKGVVFGATHQKRDKSLETREQDSLINLESLSGVYPYLANLCQGRADLGQRVSIRASVRDHFPLAGALAPGLFVLTALGGRGFTLAPLLAKYVVTESLNLPKPLDSDIIRLIDPRRFHVAGIL